MSSHTHSAACCSIPPIVSKGYDGKGSYKTIAGLKTYVTGPPSATKAILLVYDIFGYFPQTIQGADILALSDKHNGYQVFIPDFFEGKPADISWYPPTTEEHKKALGNFFGGIGAPPKGVAKVPGIIEGIKEYNSGIKSIGAIGFCWGGKVVTLTSGANTGFNAAAIVHPAMVDPKDAPNVTVPFCMLASKDESAEAVSSFEKDLKVTNHVETFSTQIHGWMAARANLEDPEVEKEYTRGYKTVLEFFAEHL